MRKSQRKTGTQTSSVPIQEKKNPAQKVLFLKGSALKDGAEIEVVKLRHPKTGVCTSYLFDIANDDLLEIKKFQEEPRSWFINDSVETDGAIYITTVMNRLFLFIPYLIKETKKYQPIEQMVQDEEFPIMDHLLSEQCLRQLNLIADHKMQNDLSTYRYNEEKCLQWLKMRTENLADVLECKKIFVGQGAVSNTFVKSQRDVQTSRDDYMKYAWGIISDYLPEEVADSLMKHLRIPIEPKLILPSSPPKKKLKSSDNVQPEEDYMATSSTSGVPEKPKKMSSAQRSLDKVDKKGMKSISSFFGRKKSS